MCAAAQKVEREHASRLAKIQSELQALHVKQKQLAEVLLFCFFFFLRSSNGATAAQVLRPCCFGSSAKVNQLTENLCFNMSSSSSSSS